jgi:hypothetical protein
MKAALRIVPAYLCLQSVPGSGFCKVGSRKSEAKRKPLPAIPHCIASRHTESTRSLPGITNFK